MGWGIDAGKQARYIGEMKITGGLKRYCSWSTGCFGIIISISFNYQTNLFLLLVLKMIFER